jgi:hypothetical protein
MYLATTDLYATGSKTALSIDHQGIVTTTRNYLQAAGSLRAPIFYDSDNTGYYLTPATAGTCGLLRGTLLFGDYGAGIVGSYSSYRYQLVFAMGDSYKGALDGTNVTGGYGLWYSHPNAGGVAANLNTHGLMVIENGSWQASLTNSTRAAGDMRAPIFYDLNDTSYYCNPNSNSNFYTGRFWGNEISVSGGSPTIFFIDSDEYCAMLHNNSNLFYILRGPANSTSWSQVGGYWPVYWNLGNNDATFGGAIWAAGNITAYSDAKLKENIETIDSALEKTLKLRGVYYTLIRDESKTRKLGVIAQEVQEVIPEVVMLHQDQEDEEGTLSVDYGNMVGLLIEAIKELEARVKELEAK